MPEVTQLLSTEAPGFKEGPSSWLGSAAFDLGGSSAEPLNVDPVLHSGASELGNPGQSPKLL